MKVNVSESAAAKALAVLANSGDADLIDLRDRLAAGLSKNRPDRLTLGELDAVVAMVELATTNGARWAGVCGTQARLSRPDLAHALVKLKAMAERERARDEGLVV